jgi:hypothetical protein
MPESVADRDALIKSHVEIGADLSFQVCATRAAHIVLVPARASLGMRTASVVIFLLS